MLFYNKVIKKLINKKISVSFAESCTGGLLSSTFISYSDVSKIYNLGLITYSNSSKEKLLKIPKIKINKYGSVSEEIAILMVKNLKKISKSKLCISITGIAGPSGGTKIKPVGLVYVGFLFDNKLHIFKKNFNGSRKIIQKSIVNYIFKNIDKLI
tara:strand:- start:65 stop:529 length:465 start_codon:yes stop_codon:yes gene_type:complete